MREEEESIFFPRWEGEELPSPEELMPISQTLITPHLALAFDIRNPNPSPPHQQQQLQSHPLPIVLSPPPSQLQSSEFDSADLGSGNPGGDEPARTLKRPRLVWTPQLHKRFVDAVAHLGIKNAVPKTIMQLMSVDGLTRENVASHLQKYRLYLKRMRELPPGGGGGAPLSAADAATDHLFATSHVPHHFLHPVLPYVPVTAQHHHHHHQQIAAAVAAGQQQQQQQFHHLQVGQFEPGFLSRAQPIHRMGGSVQAQGFAEDLESGPGGRGRRVLTLFPTGDN